MKKILLMILSSVAMLVPAGIAVANGQGDHPAPPKQSKAKAYGKYCKGQSKKHVRGEKGTAFSQCVRAMARADRNDGVTARKACKQLSRKHVRGEKGTAFSRCIVGVAKMRKATTQKQSKAKAYGKYCKGQSKKHVRGEKGTAFSQCVRAMARADRNDGVTARKACKQLSRKHVRGEKGTAFSRCIVGVAKMRKND